MLCPDNPGVLRWCDNGGEWGRHAGFAAVRVRMGMGRSHQGPLRRQAAGVDGRVVVMERSHPKPGVLLDLAVH